MKASQTQNLISLSFKGDKNAFSKLVTEYQTLVFRLCFRLLCSEEDAKDLTQEVFVKAWLNLKKYNSKFMFSTWLYKIASNMCIDFIRKEKNRQEKNLSQTIENINIISSDNIEKEFINRELGELLNFLTQKLTPKQRLIFTLRDIEGLESEEVEKITGLSMAKIKSNLYLARQEMKRLIMTIEHRE